MKNGTGHLGTIQIGSRKERTDPLWDFVIPIPVRRGSLLIWNGLTLHGNHPNDSPNFRMVHYLRMLPVERGFVPSLIDEKALPINLTPLGTKLFGLKEWYSS